MIKFGLYDAWFVSYTLALNRVVLAATTISLLVPSLWRVLVNITFSSATLHFITLRNSTNGHKLTQQCNTSGRVCGRHLAVVTRCCDRCSARFMFSLSVYVSIISIGLRGKSLWACTSFSIQIILYAALLVLQYEMNITLVTIL